ncbi:PEP-CTERM sorting domain-containing protein [Aeoliella sp. ICT_H6.2]|uniref:PEP-CTERM sorting domain-containing protein n=1 Tax=Aeoliella straminimaris TaxID=2954799 RepID=A0A9X2JEM1_9BACT|nr:LamG-like jellyroll fold domain-containing protein [Aeoliella straminimaris]MCO6042327.1 PEP-CTERM sorting domain-containing protein [Aeoliella straminimaris]
MIRILSFACATALVAAAIPQSKAVLLAHYEFDSGSILGLDSAGGNNNGVQTGGDSSYSTSSRLGSGALSLDGTGTGLRLDNSADFQNLTTFTIAAFVRPDLNSATWGGGSVPVGRVFGSVGADAPGGTQFGDGNGYGFGVYNYGSEGGLRYTSFLVADFDMTAASLPNPLENNEWAHVAVVVTEGTPATAEFYLNGVSVGSLEGGNPNPTTDPFHVGASGGGNTDSFAGLMDDVRVYDEALDASAIAALASPGGSGQQGLFFSIDRDLGSVTLTNDSAFSAEVRGYSLTSDSSRFDSSSWLSIADNYDQGNGGSSIDPDDEWLEFSAGASDLSEGTQGEVVLSGSQVLDLGTAWRKGAIEDVVAEVLLADGTSLQVPVQYTGNGGVAWQQGDLDFDNDIDLDDYSIYNAGLFTTGIDPELSDSYLMGDLDGDQDNDFFDFLLFKNAYVAAGGNPAALTFGAAVPEPSTTALLAVAVLGMVGLRKWNRIFTSALAVVVLAAASASSQAALLPVFEYSFPASYDGSGPESTVSDTSAAGNHAVIDAGNGTAALVDDRPAGFDASLMSITGSNGAHGATEAIDLLENSVIDDYDGFMMDVWMKWEGVYTDTRKMIDYAGTEFIRTSGGEVQFGLSNSATVLGYPINANEWYHVQGAFITKNHQTDIDGNLVGNAYLLVNGEVVDHAVGVTKTSFGDSLDRPIGINRWAGGGGDWNQGWIFEPAVYLGNAEVPEPSSIALVGVAALGLLLHTRRRVGRLLMGVAAAATLYVASGNAALADFTPVFEYSFPASYNNTGPESAITDLSSAGNNAALDAGTNTAALIDDRPAGFDSSQMSLTGANGGHGDTDAIDLLENSIVDDHGGYMMDVWMQWEGTYTNGRKLIDYAGTEFIYTQGGDTEAGTTPVYLRVSNTLLSHTINANEWYHVQGVFDSGSNQTDANGDLLGDAYLYVNGELVDSAFGVTKTSFGDSLDRPIGINRWGGGGGEWNQGLIFNPSVYLGKAEEPMRLTIDASTGETAIAHLPNDLLPDGREIDFYQISSASGALTTETWESLADSGQGGSSPADYNGDGNVDIADYTVWRNTLGSTGAGLAADGNGDQVVDAADYEFWKGNFGTVGASGWAEAGVLSSSLVGESYLTGSTLFDNGTSISLGDLWNEGSSADPTTDLVFQYHVVGESGLRTGAIELVGGSLQAGTSVPEPSSLLLLGVTAVGLLVSRRRVAASRRAVRHSLVAILSCVAAVVAAPLVSASSTNDRFYPFGESSGDGGANGVYVVDSNFQATFDDEYESGNLTGTAHDLLPFEYNGTEAIQAPGGAGPQFTSVAGRPLAAGSPIGVRFDGQNDLLIGARLGLPQSSASSLTGDTTPPTQGSAGTGPFDYSGITRRGFQLWVNPDESNAVFGTAQQTVVLDSSQHGVLISDTGTWMLSYNATNVDSGVAVKGNSVDNGWSHVMVVSPNDGAFVGSILYVDGLAVAAESGGYINSDFPLVIGASNGVFDPTVEAPNPVYSGGTSNYFAGTIDEMSMFVLGTSIGGVDYGTFDLATDNEFVADALTGFGPADLNGDGLTTNADVTAFIGQWGSTNLVNNLQVGDLATRMTGDFNIDGTVDLDDWQILTENYTGSAALNLGALLAGQPVPEPSSLMLLALVGVVVCGHRLRR